MSAFTTPPLGSSRTAAAASQATKLGDPGGDPDPPAPRQLTPVAELLIKRDTLLLKLIDGHIWIPIDSG
jgi:hypothetical protein